MRKVLLNGYHGFLNLLFTIFSKCDNLDIKISYDEYIHFRLDSSLQVFTASKILY